MIYLFVQHLLAWLEAHHLGFLRVFTFVTFQATASILLSFFICILFGPRVIAWLRRQKIGDLASFDQAEMDKLMEGKRGTPTMGGLLIISSIAVTTVLLADLSNFYVQMALLCLLWLGAVGATDDWLKLTAARRSGSRQGLTSREKLLFQLGLGVILCFFTYHYGRDVAETHTVYFPFFKHAQIDLGNADGPVDRWLAAYLPWLRLGWINWGMILFILIGTLVLTGSSNAVNLTDGLDGLAAGSMAIVSFSFLILCLIADTLWLSNKLFLPLIPTSGQMAVLAGAMTGACLGFLWFNCNPARVFMGDTGSLALGGLIGYIAIVIRHELMLFFVGGIFVIEAFSVMIQVGYFKYSRRRYGEGRRIFLMAPLHHHFQKKGWTETQVVVRFWLIGAMLAAMGLATLRLR
jgi:phospho-N-acetylmuramoyl-pentapeptide-transferase